MCNLYQTAPKDHVELYFRAIARGDVPWGRAVGPFGDGGFVRPADDGGLEAVAGQWGMIAPGSKTRRPSSRAILTNNARAESIHERHTYRRAWAAGQRCLIPATWVQEPNWETGKNIWWQLRRSDGAPWSLAGIWSEWVDPATGEVLPNYSLITCNCDAHPLLNRLHKPDPALPPDSQDKRSVVEVAPENWEAWLHGDEATARSLIVPPPVEMFDLAVTQQVDALLAGRGGGQGTLI